MTSLEKLVYGVYKARLIGGEPFLFSASNVRMVSLIENIKKGERLIELESIEKIHETPDRNEARQMAEEI